MAMSEPLKAGIIGLGRIGSSLEKDPLRPHPCTHAGYYADHPRVRLASGADIREEARRAFQSDWKMNPEKLYSDYRVMLQKEDLDIVSIAAYAPERKGMCLAALEEGAKGLWIEKALGCSLQDAIAIQEAINDAKVSAVVDYPRRSRKAYRAIKRIIDSQEFGRLQSVTCHMTHQLIHTGTHAFDILRYWCGEACSITGSLENGISKTREIEDQGGSATIEMSSGTIAFISAYRKKYYIFQFDLIFENARILIGNDIRKIFLPSESGNYSGFKELFEEPDFQLSDPHRKSLLDDLIESMDTGEEPISSVHNAIEALKIGLAIFDSSIQKGKAVDPQTVSTDFRVESV